MANRIDDLVCNTLRVPEDGITAQTRATILKQETGIFPIPWTSLRIWDAYQTPLTGTGNTDDLALVATSMGAPPTVTSGDVKASTTTRYARFQVVMPECYIAGQPVSIVLSAGMVTTVAGTSCTVDVEAYRADKVGAIGADICATSATTINSLVFGDKSFTITPATLNPGDILDVRIAIACVDAATATAVKPTIAGLDLQCAIKG